MIFGQTRQERKASNVRWKEQASVWTPWLAWRPVKLDDGRWAWMEDLERFPLIYENSETFYQVGWRYRSRSHPVG